MDRPTRQRKPGLPEHASLALTKFNQHDVPRRFKSEDTKRFFLHAASLKPPPGYQEAYERWRQRLEALPGTVILASFRVEDRMVVGIGAANILQNSLTMNRLWGMPLIPGSALKGLARHYAAALPDDEVSERQSAALFGSVEDAGYLTWLDAWHVPDLARSPYALDVVTPHHGRYYENPETNPPWDFDDPIPSNFLSVRGSFLIGIQAPDEAWAQAAMNLLRRALAERGIGAKTSSGYGRLTFVEYVSAWVREADAAAEEERLAAEAQRKMEEDAIAAQLAATAAAAETAKAIAELIDELDDPRRPIEQQATRWAAIWDTITDDAERTRVGTMIIRRLQTKGKEYHRVSGRLAPGYTGRTPGDPRTFMKDLLAWMDERAPEISQP